MKEVRNCWVQVGCTESDLGMAGNYPELVDKVLLERLLEVVEMLNYNLAEAGHDLVPDWGTDCFRSFGEVLVEDIRAYWVYTVVVLGSQEVLKTYNRLTIIN